jgi:hypothetical protein
MNSINICYVNTLACGMCADTLLTGLIPFIVYWLFILLAWSLFVGPSCLAAAKRNGEIHARNPLWFFPILIIAWIIGAPLLMGAVIVPVFFVMPLWISEIIHNLRQPNVTWRRSHQTLTILLLLCIPISYALPKPFATYRAIMNDQNLIKPSASDYEKAAPEEWYKDMGAGTNMMDYKPPQDLLGPGNFNF